jgi:hypothetical protein
MNPCKGDSPGDWIPGSCQKRAYCAECGEPMRVASSLYADDAKFFCERCEPPFWNCPDTDPTTTAESQYHGSSDVDAHRKANQQVGELEP